MSAKSFLALGDSYTVGQGISPQENWPSQLIESLRDGGWQVDAPRVVAGTGWTADELLAALDLERMSRSFDLVSLMIGVNNQYRGGSYLSRFVPDLESLLRSAIGYSGNRPQVVVVLSIPDWGQSPFAADHDRSTIATEIDQLNLQLSAACTRYRVNFVDVTEISRQAAEREGMFATDGLHPSAAQYRLWLPAIQEAVRRGWG